MLGLGQGRGPVFPVQWAGHVPIAHNSEWGPVWGGNEVMWAAPKAYRGPVLIRGRQLDGPNLVRFGDGPAPVDELRLMLATAQTVPAWSGRLWDTYTRLAAPGCYGWQVDGTSFSRVIVFSATLTS